jgi:CubicO group peptidase (beta-lactamase class C family)
MARNWTRGEPACARFVREIVAEGRRLRGAQLVVSVRDRIICDTALGAAGPDRTMAGDTVQHVFCLTKPVVATAVCIAAENSGIPLDADVRDASPRLAAMLGGRELSLRAVLSHAAGLHPVLAAEVMFQPRDGREAAAAAVSFAEDWPLGEAHAYSEFQGWNVLRLWLEDITMMSFGDAVRHWLFDPLALTDIYFGVRDDEWEDVERRIGLHYDIGRTLARPMLHELLRKHFDDHTMQSVGGYASAAGIAAFYRAILRGREEAVAGLPAPATIREMTTPTAVPVLDPVLGSEVSFGLGFMTDLAGALGPALGPRVFGHLGALGQSFAIADPDTGLVGVFCSNGFLVKDGERRGSRAALCEAMYEDVAAAVAA